MEITRIGDGDHKRVVIIGGGFAGMELAKSLGDCDLQVVLIDKNNFYTFQPLLYQVATAGVDESSIIYPYRKMFEDQDNIFFRLAEVQRVDTVQKFVETSIGLVAYDFLVIACGATTNYYGDQEIAAKAFSLKSVEDAMQLRNTLLTNFEKALQIDEHDQLNSLMDVIIVGGGPTGVELAGALSELRRHVFPKDYKELDFVNMDIHLIQSGPVLLKGMSPHASAEALKYLHEFGVKVWLNCRVSAYDGYTANLNTGEKLFSRTLIWAAGVTGWLPDGLPPASITNGNRLIVDEFNRVKGLDNVFALGDVAAMISTNNPLGHPMLTQPAIQQGRQLGKNLKRIVRGKALQPFQYHDQGALATIGRNKAVADLELFGKTWKFQGLMAWIIWMFVHLLSIIGFRNKLGVLLNWIWNYFTPTTRVTGSF